MRKKQIGATLESLFDELDERAALDLLTQKKRESGLMGDRPAQSVRPQPPGVVRPPVSLDELAEKQGIGPAADLDEFAARWPADDDPDALDAFVRNQRAPGQRLH